MNLEILKVENGYLVFEVNAGQSHCMTKKWVASTVADLQKLIGELCPPPQNRDTMETLFKEAIQCMANGDAKEERALVKRIEKFMGQK